MKITLVNPNEHRILENAGDRMPLGLLSIATSAMKRGHDVSVFDLNHTAKSELYHHIENERPDAVGISAYTSPVANEVINLSTKLGDVRKIAGGYHATAMPETLTPYFDAVCIGEGENAIEKALHEDGIITGERPNLNDLESPIFTFVDPDNYGINQSGKRAATLITSRGCPFSCSFCGKMDRKVRYSPPEKVREQMRELEEHGFESFYFVDDVFTKDVGRLEKILKNNKTPFRATTRADLMSDKTYHLLKKGNCEWLSFGIESGDDDILRFNRKGMDTKSNLNAITYSKDVKINTKGFFIIGLPGETEESAKRTIDFSQRLREKGLTSADFYFLTPFPGTPIWENPDRFGINIRHRDYSKYLQAGKGAKCVVDTENLKAERIEELVQEAKDKWKN